MEPIKLTVTFDYLKSKAYMGDKIFTKNGKELKWLELRNKSILHPYRTMEVAAIAPEGTAVNYFFIV